MNLLILVQFGNPVNPDLQLVHFFPEILSLQIHSKFESQKVEVEPLILQSQAEMIIKKLAIFNLSYF